MRVERTPDPGWLLALDQGAEAHLVRMAGLPVIGDARNVSLVPGDPRLASFFLQTGTSLIFPFPVWLGNMQATALPYSPASTFFMENIKEETRHGRWWRFMAQAYGVGSYRFKRVDLKPANKALTDYLTAQSKDRELAFGLVSVNYVIETGAAFLTGLVADSLRVQLQGKDYLWVKIHKAGDAIHSAISRELLKAWVGDDEILQKQVILTAHETYRLYRQALQESYAA